MLDFRVSTFLTVYRTLNYTKAAKLLGLTQPAVTQQIQYLENHYGTKLFHYSKKALSATEPCHILYKRLTTMTKDAGLLHQEVQDAIKASPFLSVGVTMTIGEYAVASPIAAYLSAHPDTNMHVHYGNTRELLKLLDQGNLSLALIEGYYPQKEYGHKRCRTEDFICVCSSRYPFQNGKPKTLRDLLSQRLLLRETGSGTRDILERSLAVRGLTISDFPSFLEIENMHTLIQLLILGCGISFLYRIAATEELEKGTLCEIPLADFSMQHDFDVVYDKNSIYVAQIETLADAFLL